MDTDDIILLNNKDYSNAIAVLQQYDNTEFTDNQYRAVGVEIPNDFTGQRIKNGVYKRCLFNKNSFKYAGASGTIFDECTLVDCDINGSNMQFCDFSNSKIIYTKENNNEKMIQATNLNQSSFYNSRFTHTYIENTSVSQSLFLNTHILCTTFQHSTLQDNLFCNAIISNSSFIGCNMEYSEFINVTIKDSILPFHQIPYIFGIFECLNAFQNEVKISSSMQNAKILSVQEYISLLPLFRQYYESINDYFPLINIDISNGKYDIAMDNIKIGLENYIRTKEFRKLKAVCKLAAKCSEYSRHDLSDLYFKIVEYYRRISLNPNEEYQYTLNINEIKNILLEDNTDKSMSLIAVKTDISYHDEELIGEMVYIIEDCLHYCNIDEDLYSIEIKHNSIPLSFWINVRSIDPNSLVFFIGAINALLTGDINSLLKAIDVAANVATIAAFIATLNKPSSITDNYIPEKRHPIISYVLDRIPKIEKKHIKFNISIGNMHFNYDKKKTYR